MCKHRQRNFDFIRIFAHLSYESLPKGSDINCLGKVCKEEKVEVTKKDKRKTACCGEV
jgi:hypothetical protein